MDTCDNCGTNSNLILSVELEGVSLKKYCSEYECMEMAKNQMGSMRGQMRGTHYEAMEKEVNSENNYS